MPVQSAVLSVVLDRRCARRQTPARVLGQNRTAKTPISIFLMRLLERKSAKTRFNRDVRQFLDAPEIGPGARPGRLPADWAPRSLQRKPRASRVKRVEELGPIDAKEYFRTIAREKWNYYSEQVNRSTNFLPPD